MSGNLRDTRTATATATATTRGGHLALCLVLYLFARPALTLGKRNPCETPPPLGRQGHGTEKGHRSEHETNDERGSKLGSSPVKTEGPDPIYPPTTPPTFRRRTRPGPWNPWEESLSLGAVTIMVLFFISSYNLLLMGFVDTGKSNNSACY